MSLPTSFNSKKDYLFLALDFLKKYEWLYNYSNTHILLYGVFEKMPKEWVTYFRNCSKRDLQEVIAMGNVEQTPKIPDSLKEFVEDLQKLKPNTDIARNEVTNIHKLISHNSGLSTKKMHEILHLAPFVDQICKDTGCSIIIDIGSGLGYLSHLLHHNYSYRVLGIECCEDYIKQSYRLQGKHYANSKNFVKFVNHFIDTNSTRAIENLLNDNFENIENERVCITGLHACADLSITVLDLFSKIERVKSLAVMPCCYHRIELEKESEMSDKFRYFPASSTFKEIFEKYEANVFLRRPFLRLACQQTVESFVKMTNEDLEKRSRNCMYRAILQEVVEKENQEVRRLKRKSGKSQSLPFHLPDADFEQYLHNLPHTHQLVPVISSRGDILPTSASTSEKTDTKETCNNPTTIVAREQSDILTAKDILSKTDEEISDKVAKAHHYMCGNVALTVSEKQEIVDHTATASKCKIPTPWEKQDDTATPLATVKINDGEFLKKMREKWEKHKENRCLFEALTALQFSIQSVCENVVLLDRVVFLNEKGHDCYVKRVAEGVVSPRCHALVAVKR